MRLRKSTGPSFVPLILFEDPDVLHMPMFFATDVHLLVETLDASGAVITKTIGFVQGVVQFNDRVYFEVPLKAAGASYRVTVTSFDWKGGGGGM